MLLICFGMWRVDVLCFLFLVDLVFFAKKILLYPGYTIGYQLASTQLTKHQFLSGKKESDEVVQVKLYVSTRVLRRFNWQKSV